MKYYVFSRYRQGINTSWLNEQIKNNPKGFKTLKEAEQEYTRISKIGLDFLDSDYDIFGLSKSGAWYRFFTGYWGGKQECKSRSMKKMEG